MNKTIFVFAVDNAVDIITNSSSELFVLEGLSQEIVQEMIKNVYPNYLSEYDEVTHIDELSYNQFNVWLDYKIGGWWGETRKALEYRLPKGFTFDEVYELTDEIDYFSKEPKYKRRDDFVTEENYKSVLNRIDPQRNLWFLFSIDDNPNWDMQERLQTIANRYHLG